MKIKQTLLFVCTCIFSLLSYAVNNSMVGIASNVPKAIKNTDIPAEKNYIFFFAHGLAATKNQVNLFLKEHKKNNLALYNNNYIIDLPHISFDFPDSIHAIDPSAWFLPLRKLIANLIRGNYDQTSFAQDNEIELLHAIYNTQAPKDKKLIFGGISRGGSIFFTGTHLFTSENTAAAFTESPYASIADVINFKRRQFRIESIISEDQGQALMEFLFGKYKRVGVRPIDCVQYVDKNIPLLIIASRSDMLVPWESSFLLYQELRAVGHKKAHFLLLEEGEHGFLLSGPNGKHYQQVVHAFFRYYNVPHDNVLAEAGHHHFITNVLP